MKPLRLWPGVALVTVQWVLALVVPAVAPDAEMFSMPAAAIGIVGGTICGVAVLLWWLFFSRAAWIERVAAPLVILLALLLTRALAHESIVGAHMGYSLYLLPTVGWSMALVAWAALTQHMSRAARVAALVVAVAVAFLPWLLMRTAGVMGAGSEYHWRWTPTPEELLLARGDHFITPPAPDAAASREVVPPPAAQAEAEPDAPAAPRAETAVMSPVPSANARAPVSAEARTLPSPHSGRPIAWPGFRGPQRDSIVRGVVISTDWSASPPLEMWRRAIGPGWSSFAVDGDFLYTQEQRGEEELVSCYRVSTGEPVWRHADPARFWESNGGAGPRGTPTLHDGRVYALGATGILNALDARDGRVLWSRNAAVDANVTVPDWGIASSPLVIGDVVVVALSGRLAAFALDTGDVRWLGPAGGSGYSSPHLVTVGDVPQILLLRGSRTIAISPADGSLLWEHVWLPGAGIVQPALTADGDLLIATGDAMGGLGIRRVRVVQTGEGWQAQEQWTSRGLKPYFNDYVIHKGHAYGFDGNILAAIDLADGARKWKGGRYGNGQVILLAEQDLLIVLSEDGELALVSATPDKFTEVARMAALQAKTWNHPVVVGGILLIRNGEEMAAYRLPSAQPRTTR